MSGASRARRLLAALALAGCAAASPPAADPAAVAREVAERARQARVVYLGESHDNPHHHANQARVLQDMLAQGARPALAFEMLTQEQQSDVDAALRGPDDPAALAQRLGWDKTGWPDFEMYRPLFDLARRYGLPVIALDLPRATVRKISQGGLAALPADERSGLASRLPPDPDRERDIERDIATAHCGLLPAAALPRMVDAWHARNVAMARRILEALERAPQVVVIVGSGHQGAGGLPDQIEALRPGLRQLIVDQIEEAGLDREAPGGRVVWPSPAVERPDPCEPLRSR